MTEETIEQMKARLKRQDEAKEKAFQEQLKEFDKGTAAYRAEQERKERAEEQKREELHKDLQEKREQEMKDSTLRSWLDAGGTEAEFEEAWPGLRTEILKRRVLEDTEARRASFRHIVSNF
jgi:predicted ATPase